MTYSFGHIGAMVRGEECILCSYRTALPIKIHVLRVQEPGLLGMNVNGAAALTDLDKANGRYCITV